MAADEPARVREWLPVLASALGRCHLTGQEPTCLEREAKRELGWKPRHASSRQGFAQRLG
jgi:hypothetical protein